LKNFGAILWKYALMSTAAFIGDGDNGFHCFYFFLVCNAPFVVFCMLNNRLRFLFCLKHRFLALSESIFSCFDNQWVYLNLLGRYQLVNLSDKTFSKPYLICNKGSHIKEKGTRISNTNVLITYVLGTVFKTTFKTIFTYEVNMDPFLMHCSKYRFIIYLF
jgi:hypothetical protein